MQPKSAIEVLCIDHQPFVIETITRLVGSIARTDLVAICSDPQVDIAQALSSIQRRRFDVIIIDPYPDGTMRMDYLPVAKGNWPDARVVVLTTSYLKRQLPRQSPSGLIHTS